MKDKYVLIGFYAFVFFPILLVLSGAIIRSEKLAFFGMGFGSCIVFIIALSFILRSKE